MLKFKLDNETFDQLSDAEKTFYKKEGDQYQLQVEGATDKAKVDEFRSNNIELNKKLDQFKDIDMAEIQELKSQKQKLLDAEFIERKDFDGLVNSRLEAFQSDANGKIETLSQKLEREQREKNELITRYEIEGGAAKAFSKHKINPDTNDAVMALIKSKFTVQENQVIARNGDQIEMGQDGNLTIDEFVGSLPESFKLQSTGGVAKGGDSQPQMKQGESSQDKIRAGLQDMMAKG